jgi:hypothetical protein
MDSVVLLFYTHSDYLDIAIPSLFRIKKFWPDIQIALCTNDAQSILKDYPTHFNFKYIYEFKNGELCYERLVGALSLIEEPYVVFHTDIHVFVKPVANEFFLRLLERVKTENIDCVRLHQCGSSPTTLIDNLYELKENTFANKIYYFSAGPSLWKKNSLFTLSFVFKPYNLAWKDTECSQIQDFVQTHFKNYVVYTPEDEQMLGPSSVLCNLFPFIHVTGGGAWRMWKPQVKYIEEFCREYTIDFNKRTQMYDQCQSYYCKCAGP